MTSRCCPLERIVGRPQAELPCSELRLSLLSICARPTKQDGTGKHKNHRSPWPTVKAERRHGGFANMLLDVFAGVRMARFRRQLLVLRKHYRAQTSTYECIDLKKGAP